MKKNKELVSILIINYNNEDYLDRSIKSCLNQTYKEIEILIFDDKSTDNSKKKILRYKNNKKIRFFFNKKIKKKIPAFDAFNAYKVLFKKSKGNIVCLLDSDDFFKKDKVKKIVKTFKEYEDKKFIQNLPRELENDSFNDKKNKNNFLSYWPYLAPESCISFKRELMEKFLKNSIRLRNLYNDVWFGFRLGIYSYFVEKNFYSLNENLTIYEAMGESGKYSLFNSNWFFRRRNSFEFLYLISGKKINHLINFDYITTYIICLILYLFKKN